jgi:hypothetical protein
VGTIDYHDRSSSSAELLLARGSERRVSPQPAPVAHVVPPKPDVPEAGLLQPRRFAKGTSPVGARRASPSQSYADEPTVMELGLADRTATDVAIDPEHTTPNLPLADRTKPGVALPTLRGRVAR